MTHPHRYSILAATVLFLLLMGFSPLTRRCAANTAFAGWGDETATLQITDVAGTTVIDSAPVGQEIRLTLIIENLDTEPEAAEDGVESVVSCTFTDDNEELNQTVESTTITFTPTSARAYEYTGVAHLALNGGEAFRDTDGASDNATAWKVEIADASGAAIGAAAVDVMAGQKIKLTGRILPSGLEANSHAWTVAGERIKNYTQSTSTATKTELAAGDLDDPSVEFYWVAESANAQVSDAVTIGQFSSSASATFNVRVPTATFKGVITDVNPPVGIGNNGVAYSFNLGTLNPAHPEQQGIRFIGSVTTPVNGGGKIQYSQVMTADTSYTKLDGTKWQLSSNGALVNDMTPYGGTVVDVGSSSNKSINQGDSPYIKVDPLKKLARNDGFVTYLMFQPSGSDSIWISLKAINWNHGGDATLNATTGVWSIGSGWPTVPEEEISSYATSYLPVWSQAFSDLNAVQVLP